VRASSARRHQYCGSPTLEISVLKGGPNWRVDLEMMNREAEVSVAEAKLRNRSAPKRRPRQKLG
jgi:hypothetical protein